MVISRENLWKKLVYLALEDGIITKEEEALIDAIMSDLDTLNTVIAQASESSLITEDDMNNITKIIREIEEKAVKVAEADKMLSDDEINILTKLNSIFKELKPEAIGPYSPIKQAGKLIFCSGQIALIPGTKKLVNRSIESETRQTLLNMKRLIEAHGLTFDNAVKMTIFMTNMEDYGRINSVYAEFFLQSKPARAAVEVSKLPAGANIEIEGIFYKE
jgi:2-iminobutanoate/2-iminopropanoate deaminase